MKKFSVTWPNIQVVHGDVESDMKPFLLRPGETGRGIDLPQERQDEIEAEARRRGMTKPQAMSLRRHYIKINQYREKGCMMSVDAMGIGSEAEQMNYSLSIEDSVASTLDRLGIAYTHNSPSVPGPDFVFVDNVTLNGMEVRWIEVKTFYGCNTLKSKKLAVGKIPDLAQRDHATYGPGCIAFANGFHWDLAKRVESSTRGVLLLDASKEAMEAAVACVDKTV